MYHSCIINGKNTWDDWHLIPSSRPVIALPKRKENYIELPGTNSNIDNADLLAKHPTFEDRTGTIEFRALTKWDDPDCMDFHELQSAIAGTLPARQDSTIILEDDPVYMYTGRIWLDEQRADNNWPTIVIGYQLKPFKMFRETPQEFRNIVVRGTYQTTIIGTEAYENVDVDISMSANPGVQVGVGGKWFWLHNGKNISYDLCYKPGENTLKIIGNCNATINYRGLRL